MGHASERSSEDGAQAHALRPRRRRRKRFAVGPGASRPGAPGGGPGTCSSQQVVDGLTSQEAERRLTVYGANRLVERRRRGRLRRALAKVADPMAAMLAITGGVYLAFGELVNGIVLLVALIPVLGVDVLLEARSQRALAALAASLAPRARAIRDGVEREVPTEALVPGDALVVREGDVVFADARVARGEHFTVDESHLTGESEPQERGAGDAVFAGSRVLAGHATAIVTETGRRTRFGEIAELVAVAEPGQSPLGRRVSRLIGWFGVVAVALALLVFGIRMIAGAHAIDAFLSAISLAMAAIPEEFPVVLALYLSLGALRLARRGVLVRRLEAVEALGSTTVICTDKTGTLTRGSFELAEHRALAGTDEALLEAAILASEPDSDDVLERAIVAHAEGHGVAAAGLHARWRLVVDHPFETEGKHVTHVWAAGGAWRVVMKGALEGVLAHCAVSAEERRRAEAAMAELGRAGMRVLAVAVRDGTGAHPAEREAAEHDLALLGLLGFRDPLRPEVPAAVAACRSAGIAIKVVTGDHAITARAIAEAAGIPVPDGAVVTGPELAELAPEERTRRIRSAAVLARIAPPQKHEIVERLVGSGEVVAMTGDGVNDAPALRRASIGVSMGRGATEVARGAAGLVLLEDDFSALVWTVREGRRIYLNLQQAFLFLVAFHMPVIGLAVAVPALGLPLLLLPIHLVWLELVVHPVAALVFEVEEAPADVMARPPRRPSEGLLPVRLAARSVLSGLAITAGALAIYAARLSEGVTAARAAAMTTVIAGGLALTWAERALDRPWREVPLPRSPRFWIVVAIVAASVPATMLIPPVARLLQLAPIGLADVGLALAVAAAAVVWRAPGRRAARRRP